jgi:hypothetical protein
MNAVFLDMWYGGNHVARWAGSSITNMYTDGVNWHSNGLPNEPKHSHLVKLHNILAQHNAALMGTASQINNSVPLGGVTFGLEIANCESADSAQIFTFSDGQLKNASGFCVDGTCSDLNCYPAMIVPCNGGGAQQFNLTSSGEFVNAQNGGCLDAYAQTGPAVGIYSCNYNTNQQWIVDSSTNQIRSQISGNPCLTGGGTSGNLAAYVYQGAQPFDRLAFIVNLGNTDVNVSFEGVVYFVPAISVTLVDADGDELFNTAKVDTTDVPTQQVFTVRASLS